MLLVRIGVVALGVATVAAPVAAAEREPNPPATSNTEESAAHPAPVAGRIAGVVTSPDHLPVKRVLVSVTGAGVTAIALTDDAGRFTFEQLPAGEYLLRAHHGPAGGGRSLVRVSTEASVFAPLVVELLTPPPSEIATSLPGRSAAAAPDVQLAGGGMAFGILAAAAETQPGSPAPGDGDDATPDNDPDAGAGGEADPDAGPAPHKPGERAWWLRRARRSVLKDRGAGPDLILPNMTDAPDGSGDQAGWPMAGEGSADGSLLADLGSSAFGLPVSGQVQFLTRATLAGASVLPAPGTVPGQVAYVAVTPTGPHSGAGDWAVRGTVDMTTGNSTSSWAIAGWYAVAPHADHNMHVAMSYSQQAVAGSDAHPRLGAQAVAAAAQGLVEGMNRQVGSIEAINTWEVSPVVLVGYGAEFARYGYLQDGKLFSPRADVTLSPIDGARIRLAVSQKMTAPGAEQFLPPLGGVWLPPERTFTSLSGFDNLQAERTRHMEVGLEQDLGAHATVGVRRFRQNVSSQLVALFTPGRYVPDGTLPAPGGHYYLASASGVDADGWGIRYQQDWPDILTGEVDYRVVRAAWLPTEAPTAFGIASGAGLLRTGAEWVHDVTTTLEAEVPWTSTRVAARCRVSTGFVRSEADVVSAGLDARFDIRVTQPLPGSPIEGSSWELLLALRSLFHQQTDGASIYDELLVVDPPRQLVGGLVVHF